MHDALVPDDDPLSGENQSERRFEGAATLNVFLDRVFGSDGAELETLRRLCAEAGRPRGRGAWPYDPWIEFALTGEAWAAVN